MQKLTEGNRSLSCRLVLSRCRTYRCTFREYEIDSRMPKEFIAMSETPSKVIIT